MNSNTTVSKENEVVKTVESGVGSIPLSKIEISDLNPRNKYEGDVTSLVKNIRDQGVLQPVTLRKKGDDYEVIIGGRRFKSLKLIRGEEGMLEAGEYQIVKWNDEQCIKAAWGENDERADLSPIEAGRYFVHLFNNFSTEGKKASDKLLEEKTGADCRRINELRSLAERFDQLPKLWCVQLSIPLNARPTEKSSVPTITATHWKVVRALYKKVVPEGALQIMEKAATEGWSSAKLEKAIEPFKSKEAGAVTKPADGTPQVAVQAGTDTSSMTVHEQEPNAGPDYKEVARGLKIAVQAIGNDEAIAQPIRDALEQVAKILAEQAVKAEQAKAVLKARREAVRADKAAQKAAEAAAKKAEEAQAKRAKAA